MDSEIAEAIKKEAGDSKDVHLLFRFIHGDEVPTIFAIADVVLMPYMARSALNSGVAHLALSLSRPAVLKDTPASQNLRDASEVNGYGSAMEHQRMLCALHWQLPRLLGLRRWILMR